MRISKQNAYSVKETMAAIVMVIIVGVLLIVFLSNSAKSRESIAQVKKAYLSFNNAYTMAKINEGTPDLWGPEDGNYAKGFMNVFGKYVGIQPMDLPAHMTGIVYYGLNGDMELYVPRDELTLGVTRDGAIVRFANINPRCNTNHGSTSALRSVCGELYVQVKDVNGNVPLTNSILGQNTFVFYITKDGVVPVGIKGSREDAELMCKKTKEVKISSKSCTAWAVQRGNFDYLIRPIKW